MKYIKLIDQIFDYYYDGEKNFMTPDIIGHDFKKFDGELLLIEYSQGEGITNEVLYGASALVLNVETLEIRKIELSKPYHNKTELEQHLDNITESDFKNAMRYGHSKDLSDIIGSFNNIDNILVEDILWKQLKLEKPVKWV